MAVLRNDQTAVDRIGLQKSPFAPSITQQSIKLLAVVAIPLSTPLGDALAKYANCMALQYLVHM